MGEIFIRATFEGIFVKQQLAFLQLYCLEGTRQNIQTLHIALADLFSMRYTTNKLYSIFIAIWTGGSSEPLDGQLGHTELSIKNVGLQT